MSADIRPVVALSGGVGGAKLVHGLAMHLAPEEFVIVANTGDDFEHLGLMICPDIDTLLYTLAGLADPERGWGRAGETWHFMDALATLGGPAWFRLGDRDLALHVERTRRMRAGASLSEVTASLGKGLGTQFAVIPMSDQPVRTRLHTDAGPLDFQDYFVRHRCEPRVQGIEFVGADAAAPSPPLAAIITEDTARAIVLCPSNPHLSVDPILAVPGIRAWLAGTRTPVVAVSPIIAGRALKGPAAELLRNLAGEASALAVARHYCGLIDRFVIDTADAQAADAIRALGIEPVVTNAVMSSPDDRARLAAVVLEAACRPPAS